MNKLLNVMNGKTRLKCMGIIALAFVGSLLASIWPVQLGTLYTDISNSTIATISQGLLPVALFGTVYFFTELVTLLRRVMLSRIVTSHEAELRAYCIGKLLKMPVAHHAGCLSGAKTAQLNQGVAGFSQLVKIICNDVFFTVLAAICTLAQVFLHAPTVIVLLMFTYLVVTVILSALQIHSQNGIREKIIAQKTLLDGKVCQSINNLELIRSMNADQYEKARLLPNVINIEKIEKYHHSYMGIFDGLKQFTKVSFQIFLLIVSVFLISEGKMAAGTVITVCLLFQQLIKPIDEVYRFMDEIAASVVKAKVLRAVMDAPSDEVFDIPSKETLNGNDIHIENVVVMNPEKTIPLAWFEDVTIPGNKVIALIGPNGCGKSSLIRMLNRYYPHTQGSITMFGQSQNVLSQKDIANTLYYSPQSSFFVAGTVRENLQFGIDNEVSDESLITALQSVHLVGEDHTDTVICIDPHEALVYEIGEKAEELSGGMKQRLSLARAFLRKPKLFIFDEITANLDEKSTTYVLDTIEQYAQQIGAGIVYISHDHRVLDRCEMVIDLQNKLRDNLIREVA